MKAFFTIAVLLGLLALSAVFAYWIWMDMEEVEISRHGWVALTLGAIFSFLVGAGLMTLIFFSHRRGYDDRANRPDE